MNCWLGYIIALLSGGLAGALINRFFTVRDRGLQKLTLKAVTEEVRSIVTVSINQTTYPNLISKQFVLENKTKQDYPDFDIIFEFDRDSVITCEETDSKIGKNKCDKIRRKPNECVYHIKNFNRNQKVTFKFEVAGITDNFFSAVLDKTGVELEIVQLNVIEKPSISPSKFVSKSKIEQ